MIITFLCLNVNHFTLFFYFLFSGGHKARPYHVVRERRGLPFICKIIFATQNPGKLEEFKQLLVGLPIDVVSAEEVGVTEDVVEDQETFAGNALKKAEFVAKRTGEMAVADDSGVMIDAFDGRPGVLSALGRGGGELG